VSGGRRVAYEVVRRTFEQGAYADRAFAAEAAGLDPRERRQAMRLAFGAVQRMATSDHAVEQLGGRRPMRLQAELRNALRVSAYELLFSDAVPDRAAVSEGVELARQVAGGRVAGLANAMLRRIAEAGPAWVEGLPLPLRVSYPEWVIGEWTALVGEQGAAACAEAQNRAPELCVRLNPLRAQARDERELGGRAVEGLPEARVLDEGVDLAATDAFRRGAAWPQSRSSMRPARLLAPQPGMAVLDLCAAPGGKAGQLAALMEDRGRLVCVERHRGRAAELERTLRRFGMSCAEVVVADVLDVREERFDRILLDPPCSGLGVLAGRPDARWRRTPDAAAELALLQRRMLDHARGLLAPGGRLVYSVCTLRRDECEGVLAGGEYLWPQDVGSDGFYIAVQEG
jgi:16S rRNA (cytosine967-C5)-methyltransferase